MKIIREIFRPQPNVLYLEPFFGCNYRCLFCVHGSGHQTTNAQLDPLAFERLKPLIEQISHVHMTGLGEPFLNPHLPGYLSYFREKGKSYYINTNGSLLEDAHIDLMTTSPSDLSVSLDAGDQETYEKIRSGGAWDRVVARVKRVSQMKADRGGPYPLLYLSFHINALNLMSLKKVPALATELGIDAVKLSWTQLPEVSRAHSIFRDRDSVNDVIHGVCEELSDAGIPVRNEAIFRKHVRGCWHFSEMTFVGANGAVAACCSRWITIGNIHDNPFEDIWNGAPRRRIALAILNGRPEAECEGCPQIRGADYEKNEEDFLKPRNLETTILAEKTKSIGVLPSLDGLDSAFRIGVTALLGGDLQAAVRVFTALDTKFPDFFEIKNNLAAAHYYLGNVKKCRELLHMIKSIPHNKRLMESNLESLEQLRHPLMEDE
jgi:MoaA/NifB/PqqE/SkfB family radical SAM enzyme